MSIKLKVLGLGLLAMLATSAFAVMNASATTTGHFTHDAPGGHGLITGTEGPGSEHRVFFSSDGGTNITCDVAEYHGTVTEETFETVDVLPTYSQCHTVGSAPGTVTVDVNGCNFRFHSNTNASANKVPHETTGHATTGLVCPEGVAGVLVTHPNCTMRMPPQALTGITYTTIQEGSPTPKHTVTLNATVTGITAHYEGGICIFLGTKHTATMTGSATVEAFDTEFNRVNLTAT